MQFRNLALLFDPIHPETQRAAVQMGAHLRAVSRCILLPADRHLPGRLEDLEADAVLNLITDPQRALDANAVCRMMDIPAAGPETQALMLAMDRMMFKDFLNIHNLPTPPAYVSRRDIRDIGLDHRNFGFPARVAPRRSSAKAWTATDPGMLARVVENIRGMQDDAVVERPVEGSFLYAALWDGQILGTAESSTQPDDGRNMEEIFIPANLPASTVKTAERLAQRVAELLSARGPMLVTLVQDARAGELVLGADAAPGLHRDSLFVRIAGAYGLSQRDMAMAMAQHVLNRNSMNREPHIEAATSA